MGWRAGSAAVSVRTAALVLLWSWVTRPPPGPAPDDVSGAIGPVGAMVVVAGVWGLLDGLLPRRADAAVTFARALAVWSVAALLTGLLVPVLSLVAEGGPVRVPAPDEVAFAVTLGVFLLFVPAALAAGTGAGCRTLVRRAGRRRGSRSPSGPSGSGGRTPGPGGTVR